MAAAVLHTHTTHVINEECVLEVYYIGSASKLLLLVPGAHGTGSAFVNSFRKASTVSVEALSSGYTIASYDRRGHGNSNCTPEGKPIETTLNPTQAARDLAAIINHLGFKKVTIFGNSMGAILSLQFALNYPERMEALIVHEAPLFTILPGTDGRKWLNFVFEVFDVYRTSGPGPALAKFASMSKGWMATSKGSSTSEEASRNATQSANAPSVSSKVDKEMNWWLEHEFLPVSIFTPNLFELKAHLLDASLPGLTANTVISVAGKASLDAPYAKATHALANVIGCQHDIWPGGHLFYVADPQGFVDALAGTLGTVEA